METTILLKGISIAVQLYRVVSAIKEAPEETKNALRFIKEAHSSLEYARTLRSKKRAALSENSDLKKRVDEVIKSVEIALYEIGKSVEDARVDLTTKADRLSLINRVKWLMGDKDAFGKRIDNVALVHGSLLSVIITLEPLSSNSVLSNSAPSNLDVTFSRPSRTTDGFDDFPMSPYQRNAKHLELLTINIADFDEKTSTSSKIEQSPSLLAIELAGRAVSEPPALPEPSTSGDANMPPPPEANEPLGRTSVMATPLANRLGELYSLDLDSMLVKRMRRAAEMSKSPEPEPKRAKHIR